MESGRWARDSGVLGRQYLSKCYKVIRVFVLSIVLVLLVGNVAICFATMVIRAKMSPSEDLAIHGVANLMAVDDRLWRGRRARNGRVRGAGRSRRQDGY